MGVIYQDIMEVARKIITMLLSGDPSHGALLRLFGLGPLLALPRDIKKHWYLHTVDDVILVIPKNRLGANHIYEELVEGENMVAYQKDIMPW